MPEDWRGDALVAEHGTCCGHREDEPLTGYRVMRVRFDDAGQVIRVEPFITGFLENNNYVGRPVDVEMMKDGSLLVSDDYNGAIWRVSYGGGRVSGR